MRSDKTPARFRGQISKLSATIVAVIAAVTLTAERFGIAGPQGSEPAVQGGERELPYLQLMHGKLHKRWADNFLPMLATLAPASPLNERSRAVAVVFSVDLRGGVGSLAVESRSGSDEFDQAAIDVVKDSAPLPIPPAALLADDGMVHVRWVFARDERGCSQASLAFPRLPLEQAVPRLVQMGRASDALARIANSEGADAEGGFRVFAQLWLQGMTKDAGLGPRAAVSLVRLGDRTQLEPARQALGSPKLAASAAMALHAQGVRVCDYVRDALSGRAADARLAAALALSHDAAPCSAELMKLFLDSTAPVSARAAAVQALASSPSSLEDASIKDALAVAARKETAAEVRAAALLASVPWRAGRSALVRMVDLFSSPSAEIRAAAAAGAVRAAGDQGVEQLFKLWKDRSPLLFAAAAGEAAKLDTEASAKFLGKLLRRPGVGRAAADALAARNDAAANRVLRAAIKDSTLPIELRAIAIGASDVSELQDLARDPLLARAGYRVFLRHGDSAGAARWIAAHAEGCPAEAMVEAIDDWISAWSPIRK